METTPTPRRENELKNQRMVMMVNNTMKGLKNQRIEESSEGGVEGMTTEYKVEKIRKHSENGMKVMAIGIAVESRKG